MKDYLKPGIVVTAVVSGLALGMVCRLGIFFGILAGCIIYAFLPQFVHCVKKEQEAYKRFTEAGLYMEQMESSFQKNRRIYPSLKETLELFPESEMEEVLQRAVGEFEREDAGAEASQKAFALIEESYGCEQMELMHSFFLRSEEQGGDCSQAIGVLRKRRNAWMDGIEQCRSDKKNLAISVTVSLAVLFFVSECMMFFLPGDMNVMSQSIERGAVIVMLGFLLFLAHRVWKKNAQDWLSSTKENSAEVSKKDHLYIEHYNPKKEIVKSLKWAAFPFVLTVILVFVTKSIPVLIGGGIITVLFLNQHRMEYHLKKKRLEKELERDFPKWMFHVILLLETESVQGAILKSEPAAPNVLKYPLEKLCDELREHPVDREPYFRFLKEYEVPKIQEAMKLLYSISSGTGGDAKEQMLSVIEKNNDMIIRSEKIKNESRVAGIMIYLFLPVIPVGIKMLLDVGLVLVKMYTGIGSTF